MHSDDLHATIAAWRDSGADRADPVRFCFIAAIARRAARYDGEAGRLLEARLTRLVADYREVLARAPCDAPARTASAQPAGAIAALAALSHSLARPAHAGETPARHTAGAAPLATAQRGYPAEPELVDYFRETWARVSVERQLRQSQQGVPENAGPLNTNHLVHRALSLMREVSPGYLEQFLSYVDALSWLDGMHIAAPASERETPHAAPRKPRARSSKPSSGTQ
ncbi:DUF2894 domain-containing protein [Cupriavidus pauculus]|jgi:hypothetical protein|uniref:DUF2894 domain-containing protein n=1 Tax=Cupriavidus pauculus TaxID=82633 RepID=UPI0030FCF366